MKWLIYLCFLVSGVTGLVYEVVWGRFLQLFIGASSYAHTVVLATFMGGLALGNALFGRVVDRPVRKLRLYGLLEVGIGLTCALFPALFEGLSQAYLAVASPDPTAVGNLLLKLLFAVLGMLLPSVLMGGTLPVLAKYVIRHMSEVGNKVGILYFLNSAGAMTGCLLAGFYLVAKFGLELSMVLTAFVNVAIGILFLVLARKETPTVADESPAPVVPAGASITYTDRQVRWTYGFIFVTGTLTMVYELVWIRLLGLVMGSSTYSFSIMLFTFIGGIALGGLIVSQLLRKERDALMLFALCELGVFLSLILLMPLYERLPYTFVVLASVLTRTEATFPVYVGLKIAVCTMAMSLPAVLIGMTLPLASRVGVRGLKILGTGVGSIFSVNTLGNVIGAVLGGFVLIPWLGLQGALQLGIFFTGLAGIGLLVLANRGPRARYMVGGAAAVAFVATLFFMPRWDPALLNGGIYRKGLKRALDYEAYAEMLKADELVYHKDGPDTSVVVMRGRDDPERLWLKVNGKTDASTMSDMSTQLHLGHLPMLLHPNPKRGLIIGLGSGCTANAVLKYDIERLDIVEISEAVVEASRHFAPVIPSPMDDPRVHLHVTDAKEYLRLQPEGSWDFIISEPSNPWIAGIGNLFSEEFFHEARSHLRAGGVMVQWVQLYELNDRIAEVIFNTFGSVFPQATLWHPGIMDVIAVGAAEPLEVDFDRVEQMLASPAIHDSLNDKRVREKIDSALLFFSMQLLGPKSFRGVYPGEGIINSDYFPFLEFEAPRMLYVNDEVQRHFHMDVRRLHRDVGDLYLNDYLGRRKLDVSDLRNLIGYFGTKGTAFDDPLLPGLMAAYDDISEGESVAHDLYLQGANLKLFGERALWKDRQARGAMSKEDWLAYLRFEARALRRLTNVYVDAPAHDYEAALRECLARFPEKQEKLLRDNVRLAKDLGRKPYIPAP